MTGDEATWVAWATFEDTVRRWLPTMGRATLDEVAADLRPGSGGPWEGLPAELDARRQLLLADVVDVAEAVLRGPWPILSDQLPQAPDSPAGLSGDGPL